MNKKYLLSLSFSALSVSLLHSSVTISFQAGALRSSGGDAAPVGSVALLVADTGSDGFIGDYVSGSTNFSAFDGLSFSRGQALSGGNDLILEAFTVSDLGGFSGVNGSASGIDVTGAFSSGDQLALYWLPTVTGGSNSGNVVEYGFYRSDSIDTDAGSEMSFVIPADGANLNLFTFDTSITSGTTGPSVAELTAVPEPSTFALLSGVLALGWVMFRRKG